MNVDPVNASETHKKNSTENDSPTKVKKEKSMTKVDELIHILSKDDHAKSFTKAKSKRVCIICGQKALNFNTVMAQFEYNNSAICQICQTEYL